MYRIWRYYEWFWVFDTLLIIKVSYIKNWTLKLDSVLYVQDVVSTSFVRTMTRDIIDLPETVRTRRLLLEVLGLFYNEEKTSVGTKKFSLN